jgi:protein gp37
MSGRARIEWTEAVWNPTVGCTRVSPGCARCYAKTLHDRRHAAMLAGKNLPRQYAVPFEQVQLLRDRLTQPLRWRRSRLVFVNSVSDLFHDQVPDEFLDRVFAVMALVPRHTFQVLTKRPARMGAYLRSRGPRDPRDRATTSLSGALAEVASLRGKPSPPGIPWPLPNVWLGVSVENQRWADERIPMLIDAPAAVRFLSCEPLLGPVAFRAGWLYADFPDHITADGRAIGGMRKLHWVIAGAESGRGARPMDVSWVRSLRDQCVTAGIPFFFKQQIVNGRKVSLPELDGRRWTEMPHAWRNV